MILSSSSKRIVRQFLIQTLPHFAVNSSRKSANWFEVLDESLPARKSNPDFQEEIQQTQMLTDSHNKAEGAWRCSNCDHLNWPQQRICKKCTVGTPNEEQKALLQQILWTCPKCTARTNGDNCGHCGLVRCTVHNGYWVCSICMWRNIPVHLTCRKCIRGRPTREQRQLIQQIRWVCGVCRHHNFTDNCFKCGSPKSKKLPDGVGGESLPDGAWYCVRCSFLNFPNYSKCRQCQKEVPTREQLIAIHNSRWNCAECNSENYEPNLACYNCNAQRPPNEQMNSTVSAQHWVCSRCMWRNIPVHLSCQKCIQGRPTDEQRQLIQQIRWVCGICKHHNFADECFKCSAPKSKGLVGGVGGESLSDGSWYCVSCWFLNFPNFLVCRQCREGVPTDDQLSAIHNSRWECDKCDAYNFSPASNCYKCNASRPSA